MIAATLLLAASLGGIPSPATARDQAPPAPGESAGTDPDSPAVILAAVERRLREDAGGVHLRFSTTLSVAQRSVKGYGTIALRGAKGRIEINQQRTGLQAEDAEAPQGLGPVPVTHSMIRVFDGGVFWTQDTESGLVQRLEVSALPPPVAERFLGGSPLGLLSIPPSLARGPFAVEQHEVPQAQEPDQPGPPPEPLSLAVLSTTEEVELPGGWAGHVRLYVNRTASVLTRVVLVLRHERSDNVMERLSFSVDLYGYDFDGEVPEESFRYAPPEGMRVLDVTEQYRGGERSVPGLLRGTPF